MGLKSLFSGRKLRPWPDVLDPSQDGKSAPSLWEVVSRQTSDIYADPDAFFKRTFFTLSLKNVLEGVANRIQGKPKSAAVAGFFAYPNVVMLASRFGGGKTHTLITLYHAFSRPESLKHVDPSVASVLSGLRDVQVVSLDADSRKLVPHPLEPYSIENFRISTIWGMLAYRLGEYGKVRHLDSGEKPVPEPDTLKEILKGKRVLILMDEIVKYAFNMQRSKDTANYGDKVVTFVENLAKAVEDTDSVLVIAVQADYRRGTESTTSISLMDFTPDYQYKEQAEKIIQALRRVSPSIVTPVGYDDMGQVLRRRIFEEIPDDSANQVQSEFHAAYREHQGIFGVEGRWDFATATKILSIKDTYPFHPKYIDLLSDLVGRNRDLQRTRDAVNITRKVVRSLLRSDTDSLLIMPGHLDLRDREIRDNTVTESYARDFDPIVNKDIVSRDGSLGNVKRCSNPDLAKLIANVVLLKTFTYETFKAALQVFPDMTDVALMVYEPDIFARTDATPLDIQDLLNEMAGRLDHFIGDKGRFWFSPYRSVIEIIDKMAESIVREGKPKLYKKIEEIAQTIINASASKARESEPLVFKDCRILIIKPGYDAAEDASVRDDERMKLVVFIKQSVSDEEIQNVIRLHQGTPRLRKNTIAAVFPDPNKNLDDLLLFAARIIAAVEVMGNLKEYYADQDVRGLQERKLKGYRDQNEIYVRDGLLSTLTKIAFPSSDPPVKIVTGQKAPSLIEQVERSLNSAGAGYKIREKIDFSELTFYLKKTFGIDIVEGEKGVDFRYLFDDLFLAKPEGPFVSRGQIEQALRQGLRTFDIGINQEGKLYWKIANSLDSEEPSSVSDRSEILPYKLAARELVSTLRKGEKRERTPEGHVLETKYYVKILDELKPLATVVSQPGFENTIKENLIIRKETRIEEGFDIVLDQSFVTAKPLKHISIKFSVEAIGGFADTLDLQSDIGSVKPSKGKPPFSGSWELDAPSKAGTFKHVLSARSGRTTRGYDLNLLVESEFKVVESESLDVSQSGSQLIELRPASISAFKIASDALDKLGLEGRARARVAIAGKVTCEITEMNPSLCSFLLQRFDEFKDRYGSLFQEPPEYSGTIEIVKPLTLEARVIANLQTLNKKAKFVIQVPR